MATIDDRVTALETEFRTELRHLASKEDLANLRSELQDKLGAHLRWVIGVQLVGLGAVAAIVGLLA